MTSKAMPGMENWFNPEAFKPYMNPENVNFEKLMESHRRNMEVFSNAGQAAADFSKNIAQAQAKYVREAMENANQFWRDWLSSGTSWQDKIEIQNQATRDNFSKAMEYTQEISKMCQKSQDQLNRQFNERFAEGFNEAQKMAKRTTEAATKTK